MSRHLNVVLAALAVIAAFVMFATSGEPVVAPLRGTAVEPTLTALGWPNTIAFNLAVGYLVSALFWLLVVHIPERTRRAEIRENHSRSYRSYRESTLQILLWASIGTHDSQMPRELSDHRKFKEFFGANKSERWYAAMNGLQGEALRMGELILELEIFADEVAYVLNALAIQDAKVHSLFKVLKENIYRLNHSSVFTDEQVKYVGRFLWEVLAYWSFIDGQRESDIIQDTIDRL